MAMTQPEDALRRILHPGTRLSRTDIDSFLALRVPEGLRLDYKQKVTDDSVIYDIAAMSNTSGGVVLIGVGEDSDHLPLADPDGVTLDERDSLARKAFDRLEPTLDLDIEPVPLTSGRYVLVVRVAEAVGMQPVVVKGRVYIRIDSHSVPAPRQQLLSLVGRVGAEVSSSRHLSGIRNIQARGGAFGIIDHSTPGLAIRAAIGAEIPRWHETGPIRSLTRKALLKAAGESALEDWLAEDDGELGETGLWSLEGPWTSITAAIARRWQRPMSTAGWVIDAQVALDVPHPGGSGGVAMVYLDIAITPDRTDRIGESEFPTTQSGTPSRHRFTLPAFYALVDTLMATTVEQIGPTVFTSFLGGEPWVRQFGPHISVEAGQGAVLGDFIRFGDYPRAREARNQTSSDFGASPADDVSTPETRRLLVVEWLELLYLNQGYYDFEPELQALGQS